MLHLDGFITEFGDDKDIGYEDIVWISPLNAELNPICHLLALLGAHHILHVSRVRVNVTQKRVVQLRVT